jgi:integrase
MNRYESSASGLVPVISGTVPTGSSHLTAPLRMERSGKISISQAIDAYMASYAGRDTSRLQRMSWWQINIGHITLAEIDEDHIFYAIEELQARKPRYYAGKDADGNSIYKPKNKPYSPATINRYVAAAAALFTWCIKKRLTPKSWVNPCKGIEKIPEHNEIVRFLSDEERIYLLNACKQSKWSKLYLLVILGITSGARKGELLKLQWKDIDFDRHEAIVHETKNGDKKTLPLTQSVINELIKFRASDNQLIFASSVKPDIPYNLTIAWQEALKIAQIKQFRFHDLRHTCASYLAQNGATLLEIGNVLGQRNLSVTKRYSHLATSHKSALINRVLGEIS